MGIEHETCFFESSAVAEMGDFDIASAHISGPDWIGWEHTATLLTVRLVERGGVDMPREDLLRLFGPRRVREEEERVERHLTHAGWMPGDDE